MKVTVTAELTAVDGRIFSFKVYAEDTAGAIGEGSIPVPLYGGAGEWGKGQTGWTRRGIPMMSGPLKNRSPV